MMGSKVFHWLVRRLVNSWTTLSPGREGAVNVSELIASASAILKRTNVAGGSRVFNDVRALSLLGKRAGVRVKEGNQRASATWISILAALLFAVGCSTVPKTSFRPAASPLPLDALVTQRGVLTVLGRQFTLNGYLALSATGGKRLVVTENFGNVLADVLIAPDGTAHVMRSSRAFKPEWIRRYLAADVQCLTGGATAEECPGQYVSPTHFVVQRRWYKLDLQTVSVKAGAQPTTMFDASRAEKP